MQTIAPLVVAAMVVAIVFVMVALIVAALALIALRQGTRFRAGLGAASFHLQISVNDEPRQGSALTTARQGTTDLSQDG